MHLSEPEPGTEVVVVAVDSEDNSAVWVLVEATVVDGEAVEAVVSAPSDVATVGEVEAVVAATDVVCVDVASVWGWTEEAWSLLVDPGEVAVVGDWVVVISVVGRAVWGGFGPIDVSSVGWFVVIVVGGMTVGGGTVGLGLTEVLL